MTALHIGYLTHYFHPEPGAPAARVYDLGRLWHTAGHTVTVLTTLPNHPEGRIRPGYRGRLATLETVAGMAVHRRWLYPSARRSPIATGLCHGSFALHAALAARLGHAPRPDLWIASSPPLFTGWAGAHISAYQRVPLVLEVRDLWPDYFAEMGVLRNRLLLSLLLRLERTLYARARAIVTVAEGARAWLSERKRVPRAKIHCIPNGVDPQSFAPAPQSGAPVRRRHGLDGKFVVAYVGNHGLGQGLESVVDAARQVTDQSDLHFLFVGDGAEKARAVARAAAAHLSNVTFLPACPRDEVASYYQAADVCLVPLADIAAFRNTIPSKLFEILGSARPVIGALRGEGADVITRSGAGSVVAPADAPALARAVRQLHALTPAARHALGESGRRFVSLHYDRRQLAEEYLALLGAVRDAKG